MPALILIGFASSGKTAVGQTLAAKLDCPFVDLDREIESLYRRKQGRETTCRELYVTEGKTAFTDYEHRALAALSIPPPFILATGGGTPLQSPNRPLLRTLGRVIYIKASPDTIIQRMRFKGVPASLQGDVHNVQKAWAERDQVYTALANYVIDVNALTVEEAAEAALAAIEPGSN